MYFSLPYCSRDCEMMVPFCIHNVGVRGSWLIGLVHVWVYGSMLFTLVVSHNCMHPYICSNLQLLRVEIKLMHLPKERKGVSPQCINLTSTLSSCGLLHLWVHRSMAFTMVATFSAMNMHMYMRARTQGTKSYNQSECHRSMHPYTHTEWVKNFSHSCCGCRSICMSLNTKCSETKLTCDMFEVSIHIHVGCIVVRASH